MTAKHTTLIQKFHIQLTNKSAKTDAFFHSLSAKLWQKEFTATILL